MVITQRHAVHALLYLIVSLLAMALIFFALGAPFVAALEVIIYAGAIMVLFVFVIMMLNLGRQAAEQERQWLAPAAWIGPGILAAILLAEVVYVLARGGAGDRRGRRGRPARRSACRSSGRTCWAWNWRRCCCWPGWSARITSGRRVAYSRDEKGA